METLQLEIIPAANGYENDENEEGIQAPPFGSNKSNNNHNNRSGKKSPVPRKMSPARARSPGRSISPFNPGGGQKIQFNSNMPFWFISVV